MVNNISLSDNSQYDPEKNILQFLLQKVKYLL